MEAFIEDEKGKSIAKALDAVRQMHRDCGRLLIDLDPWMKKKGWVRFGDDDTTMRGVGNLKEGNFMANFLYAAG